MKRCVRAASLAAILAADVSGYSRLMGQDEVATLHSLQAHRRELLDPTISRHHGRIVKTIGDGMLVEFNKGATENFWGHFSLLKLKSVQLQV